MKIMNQIITVEITGMAALGDGMARVADKTLFIPYTLPGDVVKVRVTQNKPRYMRGTVLEVVTPSDQRIPPQCPHYGVCGGCHLAHMPYSVELACKRSAVEGFMRHIGGMERVAIGDIRAAVDTQHYRNRAQLHVDARTRRIGFHAADSHDVVPIASCMLLEPALNTLLPDMQSYVERCAKSPQRILLRSGDNGVSAHAEYRDTTKRICGDDYAVQYIGDRVYRSSARSFTQVNTAQTRVLYDTVATLAEITATDVVVDLYCGVGTIGLYVAKYAARLYGVECVPQAIDDARHNAASNGVDNATFVCGDAAHGVERLRADGLAAADVVICDPPRKGCSPQLLDSMMTLSPRRIAYVSCDPATLARDARILCGNGYALDVVVPVDMFPRTAHIECVARFDRT